VRAGATSFATVAAELLIGLQGLSDTGEFRLPSGQMKAAMAAVVLLRAALSLALFALSGLIHFGLIFPADTNRVRLHGLTGKKAREYRRASREDGQQWMGSDSIFGSLRYSV